MNSRKSVVRIVSSLCCLCLIAIGTQSVALAQGPRGPKYATVSTTATPTTVMRGGSGRLVIQVVIAPEFHLNSAKPNDPDLIATSFAPSKFVGIHFGSVRFPKDQMVKTPAMDKPIPAYTGTVDIVVPFTVDRTAPAGKKTLGGILTFQGCNQTACYPPLTQGCGASVAIK